MSTPVSSSTKTNSSHSITTPKITPSKPAPEGIASTKSTIQSVKPEKVGFFKSLADSIKNIFLSIFNAGAKVFFCIFPFLKNIFVKKQTISPIELKYFEYQRKLYRIDSLSPLLAEEEANTLLPEFNAFEELGLKELYEENEENSTDEELPIDKLVTIGKIAAKKDHLKLIAVLKDYYSKQIPLLQEKLEQEKKS